MAKIVTILTEGFADWETGLLNGAARSFYGIETDAALLYGGEGDVGRHELGQRGRMPGLAALLVIKNLAGAQIDEQHRVGTGRYNRRKAED